MLKAWLEEGNKLSATQTKLIYKSLRLLQSWPAKLHILQSLEFLTINAQAETLLLPFLRQCLDDNNKFVRAWGYNGFYVLACQHPQYKAEALQYFEMAMRDEAPSVKARVRNIIKSGLP